MLETHKDTEAFEKVKTDEDWDMLPPPFKEKEYKGRKVTNKNEFEGYQKKIEIAVFRMEAGLLCNVAKAAAEKAAKAKTDLKDLKEAKPAKSQAEITKATKEKTDTDNAAKKEIDEYKDRIEEARKRFDVKDVDWASGLKWSKIAEKDLQNRMAMGGRKPKKGKDLNYQPLEAILSRKTGDVRELTEQEWKTSAPKDIKELPSSSYVKVGTDFYEPADKTDGFGVYDDKAEELEEAMKIKEVLTEAQQTKKLELEKIIEDAKKETDPMKVNVDSSASRTISLSSSLSPSPSPRRTLSS